MSDFDIGCTEGVIFAISVVFAVYFTTAKSDTLHPKYCCVDLYIGCEIWRSSFQVYRLLHMICLLYPVYILFAAISHRTAYEKKTDRHVETTNQARYIQYNIPVWGSAASFARLLHTFHVLESRDSTRPVASWPHAGSGVTYNIFICSRGATHI